MIARNTLEGLQRRERHVHLSIVISPDLLCFLYKEALTSFTGIKWVVGNDQGNGVMKERIGQSAAKLLFRKSGEGSTTRINHLRRKL